MGRSIVAVLRMQGGELELLERSLAGPDAVRYFWSNAVDDHGVFFSTLELELLLGRIGSSPRWDFVRVHKEADEGRWGQSCGTASRGLVVEINGPHLLAPRDARHTPRVDIGTPTWRYRAALEELHPVETAAEVLIAWITTGHFIDGLELRVPDPSAARHF